MILDKPSSLSFVHPPMGNRIDDDELARLLIKFLDEQRLVDDKDALWKAKTEQFIEGCKLAHSRKEKMDFN